MDKLQKDKLEERRKETSLKSMYFNRFLLIRYITAAVFFANVYWFISLMISKEIWSFVPGLNLVVIILASFEQCTMFSSPINDAKKSRFAYKYILVTNVLVIMSVLTPLFKNLFPFLNNSIKSYCTVWVIFIIGIVLCGISIIRLEKIKNCTDKQYEYIKKYEKSINKKIGVNINGNKQRV